MSPFNRNYSPTSALRVGLIQALGDHVNPVPAETLELIEESAQVCCSAAKAKMGASLKFDEASIFQIDSLIETGWPLGTPSSSTRQVWGCFLGQAMCHVLGGHWVETENGFGVAVGSAVAHPLGKIEKRFADGSSESISHFYSSFKSIVTRS